MSVLVELQNTDVVFLTALLQVFEVLKRTKCTKSNFSMGESICSIFCVMDVYLTIAMSAE